ncbi:hypothetical protein MSBRM_0526 [Methanosarcina barkeri MS]|uniref:Uncharacterized protein n=2 Tax=Methanosarcina barkeri TaxID=2208 RepID=A0A0E3QSN3_METBA|nr:hypothetical protein MSBRM_0526 [Methanosarcina barkeri MS]
MSPASFTNSAICVPGSMTMKAFFRSVFSVYIAMKHLITFKRYDYRNIVSKNIFDTYFHLSGLKDLSKR